MFSTFSSNLLSSAQSQGYKLDFWVGETGGPSLSDITDDVTYMAFQKIDIATLICLHVIDTTKRDWQQVIAKNAEHLKWAEGLLDKLQNVAIIYVLAGDGGAPWHDESAGFTDYHGQRAYSVFWWVNFATGEVTVPKGQPSQLFGLRGLINKAQDEIPADKKWVATYAQPVRPVPLMTYLFVGINAVVLFLMYMAGYPVDMWVPARFGAIVPDYILVDGQWWRLFTAMFVHFGVAHFFANVMGLVIFGSRVERYFGRLAFCLSYIVTGVMGSIFSLYFTRGYAAGASGAVYGLVGVIFAYTRITGRSIELMNWYIMFLFAGVGIAMGMMTAGVDNFGHLGGLIGGFVIGAAMVGILKLRGKG